VKQQIGEKAIELNQNPSSNGKPDGSNDRSGRKVLQEIVHETSPKQRETMVTNEVRP
jgi:hypothetical protein